MRTKPKQRSAKINFINDGDTPVGATPVTFVQDSPGEISAYVDVEAGVAAHAESHEEGGSDELDVKNLGGYPGGSTTFLRADGTFATPAGAGTGNPYSLVTTPDVNDFTWANQGSATGVNTSNGVLAMSAPGGAGNSCRILYQASPGAANTVTIGMTHYMVTTGSAGYENGLWLYDTGSGKALFYGIFTASGSTPRTILTILTFNSLTTAPATQPLSAEFQWYAPIIWLRIVDDGVTNRTFYFSTDGETWQQALAHARTTHFTSPSSVGVGLNVVTGTITQHLNIVSFSKS